MIVCHCRVVSDREVHDAIESGAGDLCGVAAACRAGTGCGGCLPEVRRMLADRGLETDAHLDPRALRRRLEHVLAGVGRGSDTLTAAGAAAVEVRRAVTA